MAPPANRCCTRQPGLFRQRRTRIGFAVCLWISTAVQNVSAEDVTAVSASTAIQAASTTDLTNAATRMPVDATLQDQLRQHVEFLASRELRGRGGPERRLAADYIEERFRRAGLVPIFAQQSFRQDVLGHQPETGAANVLGQNIGGMIRGTDPALADEVVLVCAHYDHLGANGDEIYCGADDNASGIAMVLEAAAWLARQPAPRRSIAFVTFDLEERLLWGSRWFCEHPPWPVENVKFCLTADMIGRSLGDLPLPTVFALGAEHSAEVQTFLDRAFCPEGLEIARLGVDLIGTRSDYGPFRDRQIPFLFLSTGQHPDYHTPQDVAEKVDYARVSRVTALAADLLRQSAAHDDSPAWQTVTTPDLREAETLNRLMVLLLQEQQQRPLTDLQRYLAGLVRSRTRKIIEARTMTASDRTWLIRMSQVLLVTVF